MKILFLSNMNKYSGGEIVLERLIKNLDVRHFSSIIALPEGDFAKRCRDNGIDIWINDNITKLDRESGKLNYFSFMVSFARGLKQLKFFVKGNGIDLVVANSFGISIWAYMLSFVINKKIIWIHHHPVLDGKKIDSKAAKFLSSRFSRIICVSQAIRNSLILSGVSATKAQVIYNGLDLQLFQQSENKSAPVFNKEKIVISLVGAIIPWKGHAYLIEAIHLLEKSILNKISVEIVGSYLNDSEANLIYNDKLRNQISNYDLDSIIQFKGHIENMSKYYRNEVDILLNCSQEPEPLGTTIYEAMAYSKMVVVTNVGGSTEIVENLIDGFVVDFQNPADLAACLTRIISEYTDSFLGKIKHNARLKVEEKFDIRKNAKQYEEVFKSLKL